MEVFVADSKAVSVRRKYIVWWCFRYFSTHSYSIYLHSSIKKNFTAYSIRVFCFVFSATFVLRHPEHARAVTLPIVSCINGGFLEYDKNSPPFASFIPLICPKSKVIKEQNLHFFRSFHRFPLIHGSFYYFCWNIGLLRPNGVCMRGDIENLDSLQSTDLQSRSKWIFHPCFFFFFELFEDGEETVKAIDTMDHWYVAWSASWC